MRTNLSYVYANKMKKCEVKSVSVNLTYVHAAKMKITHVGSKGREKFKGVRKKI